MAVDMCLACSFVSAAAYHCSQVICQVNECLSFTVAIMFAFILSHLMSLLLEIVLLTQHLSAAWNLETCHGMRERHMGYVTFEHGVKKPRRATNASV